MGVTGITEAIELLSTRTSSSFGDRGNRRPGARRGVENRYVYGVAQTPTRLLGRQTFRPQSANASE